MWVTYFENMPQDESFFRSYSEFLRQTEVNGELTYIIGGAVFEKEESTILKMYRNAEHGFICYCSKESKEIKDLAENLSSIISSTTAKIPLEIISSEIRKESYSNMGYANINPSVSQSLKSFAESLINSGIFVNKIRQISDKEVSLEISSSSVADLISDIEFVRYFCLNFFTNQDVTFSTISRKSSKLLELSLQLNRKIKAAEKKKISKIENSSIVDNSIELRDLFSNSQAFHEVMSVVCNLSP